MANARFPLAKMPSFTTQQLAWLRGHFYEEIGQEDTLDFAVMSRQAGINRVVLIIEAQSKRKNSCAVAPNPPDDYKL